MGTLASYLQHEFFRLCPEGWSCQYEKNILSNELETLLGYASRVDLLLEEIDGSRKIWIEFEVSRADPVANHTKFATAHLFQPQTATDVFLSMVSSHVTRGRHNLAANAISLMRTLGMTAFQTTLLPHIPKEEIKRLNHSTLEEIEQKQLKIQEELERVMLVSKSLDTRLGRHLHFAGNLLEVMLNLRQWNQEMETPQGQQLWGKRTVTYFVFDPLSKKFAPSKFCAYLDNVRFKCSATRISSKDLNLLQNEGRFEASCDFCKRWNENG